VMFRASVRIAQKRESGGSMCGCIGVDCMARLLLAIVE
jgi:hypothetical protein